MKITKATKKGLSLHKESLRGLNGTQLEGVRGGISGEWCSQVISCYQSCNCDSVRDLTCGYSWDYCN